MRLGDLDALFCQFWGKADPFKEQTLVRPCVVWSDAATMAREAPTIDPETIPVVRQLREENARLRNEVMRIREFENPPMHTIIFEMKYADFMDAGRVEELAAEVLIGLMAKDAASRHPVKEVTL